MHGRQRRREIHFANHLRLAVLVSIRSASGINNHEIVRGHRTQADRIRRISLLHPMPIPAAAMQKSRVGHPLAQARQIHVSEALFWRNRQFERRALQMVHQNFQIVRLHVRMLRRTPEKIIRMLHDELIQRRRRRDHHRARCSAASASPPRALPCGSDRARITRHHARVQRADINPQFQRTRRDHATNSPVAQAALNLSALTRQVSPAIAANRLRLSRPGRFARCK